MTAAKFIQELKKGLDKGGKSKNKYDDFAIMFAKLFRSQFIAFVGNVLIAFPTALIGIWVIELLVGYTIPEAKADKLITDLSPVHSLAIFHAAIAGIFLFLSGIISGSIANRDRHLQVPYRIKEHPLLKLSLGKRKTNQIAAFYEEKWAGIMSNFWFGVFMGSTASIGAFIGLNLDIRHITFAGGNFALGLYGSEFVISGWMIFWSILGIGIIGLINFLVSFVLSLLLAFRSRKIPFSELRLVFSSNWQYFKKHPVSFFFPTEMKKSSE
jgi:site-specific recombinase